MIRAGLDLEKYYNERIKGNGDYPDFSELDNKHKKSMENSWGCQYWLAIKGFEDLKKKIKQQLPVN